MLKLYNIMKFKHKYFKIIESGIKTSTIRKHCHFKEGETVRAVFERNLLKGETRDLYLQINKITPIPFRGLTDEIARKEGFLGVDLLKAELESIYNDGIIDESELFYQIEFEHQQPDSAER